MSQPPILNTETLWRETVSTSGLRTAKPLLRRNLQKVVGATGSQLTSIQAVDHNHRMLKDSTPSIPTTVCPSCLPAEGTSPSEAELPGSPLQLALDINGCTMIQWAGQDIDTSCSSSFYTWILALFMLPLLCCTIMSPSHTQKMLFCCVSVSYLS